MGCIYIIKNTINDKVYIGQTVKTMEERWREHVYNARPDGRAQLIYLAMRKYGVENFYVEELHHIQDGESLDELEIKYIAQFNSITPNGYNVLAGGSKFIGDHPMRRPEIKQLFSERFKGDKNPAKRPEVREKIRQSSFGKIISAETRQKMSKNNGRYWSGKHLSDETRAKISQNHGCRGKFGGLNPNSKAVQRLDKNTLEVLEEYDSLATAGKWVQENINPQASWTNISKVCHGHQKTAFGYVWRMVA